MPSVPISNAKKVGLGRGFLGMIACLVTAPTFEVKYPLLSMESNNAAVRNCTSQVSCTELADFPWDMLEYSS